jgi:adhesin transport system outer membrane protein
MGLLLASPYAASADEHIAPALRSLSPTQLQEHRTPRTGTAQSAPVSARADSLGMDEAIQQAVGWHPSIGESVGALYQQAEGINVAQAGYYPQVSGGVRSGYSSGNSGAGDSQAMSISLKQMLYDFGKVSSAVDAANARVARSQAQILLSIDDVARDTAYAYIEVQRYRNLLDIARAQIKGIGDIVQLAQQRSDMGASTRSDVVQAQSRSQGAMATLQEFKASYARWQATLGNLMGRTTATDVSDGFPIAAAKACDNPDSSINALPAVLIALARRNEAQAELAGAKAQGYPTVSLEPSLNHYLDNNYNENNPYADRTQAGIYLNVEVPIYQGGATSARSRAAGHALSAADSAEDTARLQATQGLTEAQAQTSSLSRRLGALEQRQSSISEARSLYGRQYLDLGTRPLLDLLNAEQEIHQSRFDLANTVADMRRLQIDCLFNSGGLRRAFRLEDSTVQGVRILP